MTSRDSFTTEQGVMHAYSLLRNALSLSDLPFTAELENLERLRETALEGVRRLEDSVARDD